jgi:hypothetical protein
MPQNLEAHHLRKKVRERIAFESNDLNSKTEKLALSFLDKPDRNVQIRN